MLSSEELSLLWQQHAPALLLIARGYCRSANGVAEDCVQEAFIRLARQEPQPNIPSAWLLTTVRNAAIDAVRSHQRRTQREQIVAGDRPLWFEPVDTLNLDSPSTERIQNALQELDDSTRDIVVAHLWNNMTFRQIASAFDLSAATAHRKYENGIEQLRAKMTADTASETHSTSTKP